MGRLEYSNHCKALKKLPIRIHVNGARGKSRVTRLIAAGLRAGGLNTIAKVTGSAPRIIIEEGKDLVIHRLRSASIGEQVKFIAALEDPGSPYTSQQWQDGGIAGMPLVLEFES